jgi:putative oxidoreductase
MDRLFATDPSNSPLLLQRILLAVVIFPHGAQKALGWFGDQGFDATLGYMASSGIPKPLAVLLVLAETVGPLLLVLGLLARVAALGITCVMVGAILMVHAKVGFFMNWMGNAGGEGFEYHLLALGLSVPILIWGAGRASVDAWIARRMAEPARRSWREASVPT